MYCITAFLKRMEEKSRSSRYFGFSTALRTMGADGEDGSNSFVTCSIEVEPEERLAIQFNDAEQVTKSIPEPLMVVASDFLTCQAELHESGWKGHSAFFNKDKNPNIFGLLKR